MYNETLFPRGCGKPHTTVNKNKNLVSTQIQFSKNECVKGGWGGGGGEREKTFCVSRLLHSGDELRVSGLWLGLIYGCKAGIGIWECSRSDLPVCVAWIDTNVTRAPL